MQKAGLNVSYVNLIGVPDYEYFKVQYKDKLGNPRSLPDVYNCLLQKKLYGPQPALDELVNQLSPHVVLGGGYIAAVLLNQSAPDKRLVFMASGCHKMKQLLEGKFVKDYQSMDRLIRNGIEVSFPAGGKEKDAVYESDFIVVHSPMVKMLYSYFFPSQKGKIYSDVLWNSDYYYHDVGNFASLSKPFSERDIEVLFVASDWNRPEKNFAMVEKIISRCWDLNIHVVGRHKKKVWTCCIPWLNHGQPRTLLTFWQG